ncbi:UNVERIFIED_CONTAM: hypothetical protein FKN15_065375 [Acipenser sinensis]
MDRNALAELLQALESRRDAEERRREERYTALIERVGLAVAAATTPTTTPLMMSECQFNDILALLEDDLLKETVKFRKPIGEKERLAICLRFLATGDSYKIISFSYRVGKSTIDNIVPEGGAEHKVPVVISKIFKDQVADQTGMLFIGDAVLQFRGFNLGR